MRYPKLTYTGIVEGGILKLPRQLTYLDAYEGKKVSVTVEKLRSKRTTQQNRYWWACMTILAKEFGYTKDEIHDACKIKFLSYKVVVGNEELTLFKSTTQLTKSEFADMTTDLIRWASEMDIILPIPGEQTEIGY